MLHWRKWKATGVWIHAQWHSCPSPPWYCPYSLFFICFELLFIGYKAWMWIISLLLGTEMSAEFDWKLRVSIINGMARGLVYLHEDSRLRIIHRDMIRASKILLIIRWIQEFLISEWQEFLEEIRSKPIQMESLVHSMSTLLSFFLVGFRGSYYWACLDPPPEAFPKTWGFLPLSKNCKLGKLFPIKYLNGVGEILFPHTHFTVDQ